MTTVTALIAGFGIKGILLALVGIWLVFTVLKKLFKLTVLAVLVLAMIYFGLPLLTGVLSR